MTKAIVALAGATLMTATTAATVSAARGPATTYEGTVRAATPSCAPMYYFADGRGRTLTGKTWDDAGTTVPAGAQRQKFLYEGGIAPVVWAHSLDTARRKATKAFERTVVDFHNACPSTPITLVGYSYGALVAGDTAERLAHNPAVPNHLISAVLVSDPRRPVIDVPEQGQTAGIMSMMPDAPGMHMPGPRDFNGVAVTSICRSDDVICASVNPISNAKGFADQVGRFGTAHGAYAEFLRDPAAYANAGLMTLPPSAPITWGRDAFPAPTPQSVLNGDPAYRDFVNSQSAVSDALDWARVLNTFGLPGDRIVHGFLLLLEQNGLGY